MLHERRVLFTADATDPSGNTGSSVGKLPTFLYAQGTDKEEKVDLRLDLIGIVARDMRASLEFYRRLGLDIPEGAEDEPHAEATTPSGLRVAWDTAELIRQIDPEWTDPSGGHRVALAFLCPDPAGVDAKYQELAALGFGHKVPWDAFWGQRYASVKDPDGNQVDLFAPL
jgi:catechol 2,3-dioxygenase-like lactoylglutathione lyase family enzyme